VRNPEFALHPLDPIPPPVLWPGHNLVFFDLAASSMEPSLELRNAVLSTREWALSRAGVLEVQCTATRPGFPIARQVKTPNRIPAGATADPVDAVGGGPPFEQRDALLMLAIVPGPPQAQTHPRTTIGSKFVGYGGAREAEPSLAVT